MTSGAAPYSCAVLTGAEAVDRLADVDDLLAETEAPVTARTPWLRCWAQTRSEEPWLVLVRSAGEVVAAAPLAARRRGPLLELRAWGHEDSDQVRLPARTPEAARQLAQALLVDLQGLRRPWTLRVEQLPTGDIAAAALAATLPRARLSAGDVSPRTRFGAERTLAAHLSRNGRRSALQAGNRLAAAGTPPDVTYWREPADITRLLDDLEGLRRRRDHALGRPSALDTPARRAFFRTVLTEAAGRGEVEIATLHVQERLAAYDVCLLDQGWLRLWDGRIEPDLAAFGVGKLLDARVLERALADPAVVGIDWMRGDEPYKSRSANERVGHDNLVASSSAAAWAASFGVAAARSAARDQVARHPAALTRWRTLKSQILRRTAGRG